MGRKKTIEITIETLDALICKPLRSQTVAWCPQCAQTVSWLALEWFAPPSGNAARGAGLPESWLPGLHLRESTDGRILICRNSLARLARDA